MSVSLLKKYAPYAAAVFSFIVYLLTLAPTVVKIDSGELAAVQYNLGIAHPTGYPIFTIAGYLFQKIPLPFTAIFKSNLLSAIFCSVSVLFFIKSFLNLLYLFFSGRTPEDKKQKRNAKVPVPEINENAALTAAVLGGLALAFSLTFWLQSTSVEVYSLQLFLFSLMLFAITNILAEIDAENYNFKSWLMLSVFLAAGFSNHMTTLLFLPAVFLLIFKQYKTQKPLLKDLIFAAAVFSGILLISYSFLVIRASQSPPINWGNPDNLERLYRHISGKQYSVWMFSGIDAAKKHFIYFFQNLLNEYKLASLALAVTGLILILRNFNLTAKVLLLTFIFSVLFTINYDIVDIETYFLMPAIIVSVLISFAIYWIIERLLERKLNPATAALILLFPVIFEFYFNFPEADQSGNYFFEDYTKSILSEAEDSSIVLSYQWDYFVSPSIYFQFCENYKRNVVVIDKELLRRSWYYNQVQTNHPGVLNGIAGPVASFQKELEPFESGRNFNSQKLEYYFRKILTGLIETNIDKRNIYIGPEFLKNELKSGELTLPAGFKIIPQIYLYKIVKDDSYVSAPEPEIHLRKNENPDEYQENASAFVFETLLNRAIYEHLNGRKLKSEKYYRSARKNFPDFKINPAITNMLKNEK